MRRVNRKLLVPPGEGSRLALFFPPQRCRDHQQFFPPGQDYDIWVATVTNGPGAQ